MKTGYPEDASPRKRDPKLAGSSSCDLGSRTGSGIALRGVCCFFPRDPAEIARGSPSAPIPSRTPPSDSRLLRQLELCDMLTHDGSLLGVFVEL